MAQNGNLSEEFAIGYRAQDSRQTTDFVSSDSSSDLSDIEGHLQPPPRLWVYKLWYFSSFSGLACISPFLVIYYRRVGLSEGQIGILLAMQPVISIPMGAFWGMLVDRTKRPKAVLMCTLAVASICRFSVGWGSTFWELCIALVFVYGVGPPGTVLADVLALQALPDKSEYGKLRLWGAVGWGTVSPLAGLLIKFTDLHVIFYCHLALMLVCVGITSLLTVKQERVEAPSKRQRVDDLLALLRQLFSSGAVVAFFAVVVVMGMMLGCMGSYVFLFLEELGGDTSLMGLTLTVMCIAEVPAMYVSGAAIRAIGVVGVLCVVLVCYIVRLLYYSFLSQPWLILPIELLHGVTFGWGFAVGTMHAGEIAPPGLAATTQSLFNAALFNVGSGLGSLISGFIYEHCGAVFMFRSMAGVVLATLVLFVTFSYCSKSDNHFAIHQTVQAEESTSGLLENSARNGDSRNVQAIDRSYTKLDSS